MCGFKLNWKPLLVIDKCMVTLWMCHACHICLGKHHTFNNTCTWLLLHYGFWNYEYKHHLWVWSSDSAWIVTIHTKMINAVAFNQVHILENCLGKKGITTAICRREISFTPTQYLSYRNMYIAKQHTPTCCGILLCIYIYTNYMPVGEIIHNWSGFTETFHVQVKGPYFEFSCRYNNR